MTQDKAIFLLAKICHDVNDVIRPFLGEKANGPFESVSEEMRMSAVSGVTTLLSNPKMTPRDQHDAWMSHKLKSGWRYGEQKNDELKTHPCLLPYGELPPEQQLKDHVFQAIVRAGMSMIDVIETDSKPGDTKETQDVGSHSEAAGEA